VVTGVGDIGAVIPDIGGDGPAIAAGLAGPQFWRGIIAKAAPPTANVPVNNSATCRERFTGGDATVGVEGLR
jgi:hypothetical protein